MAEEQAIPIPFGLDICGSQTDLNLFLDVLNLNFELIQQLSETVQSTTISLPGLPAVSIPGYTYPITAEKRALDTAWIGGRYPLPSPAGRFVAPGRAPGLELGATGGLQFAVNAIGYNFQIIANALPTIVTQLVTVPMFAADPCSVPGGPDALIQQLNQQLEQIIHQVSLPPVTGTPGFGDTDCWADPADPRVSFDRAGGTVTITGDGSSTGVPVTLSCPNCNVDNAEAVYASVHMSRSDLSGEGGLISAGLSFTGSGGTAASGTVFLQASDQTPFNAATVTLSGIPQPGECFTMAVFLSNPHESVTFSAPDLSFGPAGQHPAGGCFFPSGDIPECVV